MNTKPKKIIVKIVVITCCCLVGALVIHTIMCEELLQRCKFHNIVFDNYPATSKIYRKELIKHLKRLPPERVAWYISAYLEKNDHKFMDVFIKSDTLCAEGRLDITNSRGLEEYIKAKGVYYWGRSLEGLKYRIDTMKDNYNFVFESVDTIADTSHRYICDCAVP